MIEECRSGYTPLPGHRVFTENFSLESEGVIPDNNAAGLISHFHVDQNRTIEWLAITITSDHDWGADLEIHLTSPAGTTTRLVMGRNGCGNYTLERGFRYGTVAFFGESSAGMWKLKIADLEAEDTGNLKRYSITVFGH
jgi:subtilisin-like proprotein convertase family protein